MNKGEREIYIKDIIVGIMKKWKSILLVGIIVGMCVCAYSTYKDNESYDMLKKIVDKDLTDKELEQEEPEIYNVLKLYKRRNAYNDYSKNAVIMRIDYSNVTHFRMNFYVESMYKFNYSQENEKDYSNDIIAYYSTFLQSQEFIDMLVNKLQLAGDAANYEDIVKVESDINHMMLVVDVICDSIDIKELEKTISEIMLNKQKEIQVIGEHKVSVLDCYVKTIIDANVKALQDKINLELSILNQQIDQMFQSLSQWQKEYINYVVMMDEDAGYQLTKPGVNLKMLILGLVLGIFITAVIYVVKGALSIKVQNKNDIWNIFGISNISEINCEGKNKTVHNKEQEDYIVAFIKKKCNKENGLEVYFIGSIMEKINTDIFDRIIEELIKEGVQAKLLMNPCKDKNSLEQISSNGVAVLVEKVDMSRYNDIEKEIKLLYDNEVAILGTVML